VTVQPVLSLPPAARTPEPWPRGPQPVAAAGPRVQPVVRWALYLYVCSIPFEMPQRSLPVEIPTLVGCVFLLATLLDRRAAYGRIDLPLVSFAGYLWMFTVAALVNLTSHEPYVLKFFLELLQVVLIFWTGANLMREEPVRVAALRAFALACGFRAALQVFGIARNEKALANLSALILSCGLLAALALVNRQGRRWPAAVRWPIVVLIAVAVVQTGSRGGLLALSVGLLAILCGERTLWARVRNGVAALAALGVLGFAAYHSEGMRNRLFAAAESGQLAGRERIYPALLVMIRERPFVGWGPVENQVELERRLQDPGYVKRDAHNLLLELLTSTGVAGTIPFLIGLAACVRSAWRSRLGPAGALPSAMLVTMLTGTMSGTWIASKILWLVLAHADAAGRGRGR